MQCGSSGLTPDHPFSNDLAWKGSRRARPGLLAAEPAFGPQTSGLQA